MILDTMAKRKKALPPSARKLKALRDQLNLSQPEAARKALIPVSTWKNWEQGRTIPPAYLIRLIEIALEKE